MSELFRILNYQSGVNELIVIGTKHTRNLFDPLFNRIQTLLKDFSERHPDGVIISENDCSVSDRLTLEESVSYVAEAGAVHWYAHKANLKVICPEPPYAEVIARLCKRFVKEEVAYTMLRVALGSNTRPGDSSEAVQQALDRQISYWARPEMQKASGFLPTKEWYAQYKEGDPFSDAVRNEMIEIRDAAVLEVVKKVWEDDKSIFLVYGKTHTDRLEPRFKELINARRL